MSARDRRHPLIELDRGTLQQLLLPVCQPEQIAQVELVERGLSSTNYCVRRSDGQRLHLRVVPGGRMVCAKEIAVLGAVATTTPVPTVLHADPGHPVYPYYIAEWVAGTPLDLAFAHDQLEDPDGLGRAVASALISIHRHPLAREGDLGEDMRIIAWPEVGAAPTPGEDLSQPKGSGEPFLIAMMRAAIFDSPAHRRLGARRAQRLWMRVVAEEPSLLEGTRYCCLVHCDYNPKNLLVQHGQGGWRVNAVLDWEFACAASPLLDLGNLLRHRQDYPTAFVEGFIAGYTAQAGWLDDDWLYQARLVDLWSAVEALSSTAERPGPHATALDMIDRFLD